MKNTKTFLLVFTSMLLISLVSAQPFTEVIIDFDSGLVIVNSPQTYLKQGENYNVNFFVYNKTTGGLIDNTTISCDLYVDNYKGELVYFSEVNYLPEEYWGETLNSSIFSELGQYQYGIKCKDTNTGGSTVGYWIVNTTGNSFDSLDSIALVGLGIFLFLLFGIGSSFSKEKWKLKSFFHMGALFIGIILLNSIRILIGSSSSLHLMGEMGLMVGLVIISFMVLYILILYTIEVFNYFKKRNRSKWEIGDSYE